MKKLSLTFSIILFLSHVSFAAPKQGNIASMGSIIGDVNRQSAMSTASGMIINAANEKVAYKFLAQTTSEITDIDLRFDTTGDTTGINWQLSIQADSSDAPDGTPLGGTAIFAGPAADQYIGLQTLSSATGALTLGNFYWAVLEVSSGTPDGSHYFQATESGLSGIAQAKIRHYDGTNWTNTSARGEFGAIAFKHGDGTYSGVPINGTDTTSGYTDIYDTNKQGIRVKFGSQAKIIAVKVIMDKAGTPGNATARVYEGSTLKYSSNAVAQSDIADRDYATFFFNSPILLSADTYFYVTIEQDGSSDSNDYDLMGERIVSTYKEAAMPFDYTMVYGSGADPTAYTVVDDWAPAMLLVFSDFTTEFDQAAEGGGGGGPGWVSMSQ